MIPTSELVFAAAAMLTDAYRTGQPLSMLATEKARGMLIQAGLDCRLMEEAMNGLVAETIPRRPQIRVIQGGRP